MPARVRTRDLRSTRVGTLEYFPPGPLLVTQSMPVGERDYCSDTHGQHTQVNSLEITHRYESYPVLSGTLYNSGGSKNRTFTNFPLGYRPGPLDPRTEFPALTAPQLSALAWRILAETNPSAPHVSLPSFAGELKDFLSLIRGRGATLLQQVAQGYISWRWAIKPLYNDLQALLKFTEAANERLRWLYKLRAGKTLRRRCLLGTSVVDKPVTNVLLHSQGAIINGKSRTRFTSKMWGTAQWKLAPDNDLPEMGYGPLKEMAQHLALGLRSEEWLATAWQLTPWSWFADWFANIDDTITACNNSIGCTWEKICFMRTTECIRTYEVDWQTKPAWVEVSNDYHVERFVRKERIPVSPILPFSLSYLPLFDEGKWSILAAIAASR